MSMFVHVCITCGWVQVCIMCGWVHVCMWSCGHVQWSCGHRTEQEGTVAMEAAATSALMVMKRTLQSKYTTAMADAARRGDLGRGARIGDASVTREAPTVEALEGGGPRLRTLLSGPHHIRRLASESDGGLGGSPVFVPFAALDMPDAWYRTGRESLLHLTLTYLNAHREQGAPEVSTPPAPALAPALSPAPVPYTCPLHLARCTLPPTLAPCTCTCTLHPALTRCTLHHTCRSTSKERRPTATQSAMSTPTCWGTAWTTMTSATKLDQRADLHQESACHVHIQQNVHMHVTCAVRVHVHVQGAHMHMQGAHMCMQGAHVHTCTHA